MARDDLDQFLGAGRDTQAACLAALAVDMGDAVRDGDGVIRTDGHAIAEAHAAERARVRAREEPLG